MRILAIETSCDETAVSVVDARGGVSNPKFKIKKSLVASQIKIHAPFGGVVPNLAKREHQKNLPVLLSQAVSGQSQIGKIDMIAVTVGPGLEPALWVGVEYAKNLAREWGKPLAGVSHLEGHLYSFLLSPGFSGVRSRVSGVFPAVVLLVSGGHTILALMKNLKEYRKLGETLDDAVGESFDKVARLLNLPYPGGPEIERLAKSGNPRAIPFPSPMISQKNYNFSYSGLKTSVLYYLRNLGSIASDFSLSQKEKNILKKIEASKNTRADIAASFQRAAFAPLAVKALRAAGEFKARSIMIGGGVAASKALRATLASEIKKSGKDISLLVPPFEYCLDNAAMIGAAAYINKMRGKKHTLKADGTLNL